MKNNCVVSIPSIWRRACRYGLPLVFLACFGCFPALLTAQQNDGLAVEDGLKVNILVPYSTASPDGKQIIYAVRGNSRIRSYDFHDGQRQSGIPWYGVNADLFLTNIETGETRDLTGGLGGNWAPAWSPDGRYVAFISTRGGTGQAELWIWHADTQKMTKASSLKIRADASIFAGQLQWTRDSRNVLVATLPAVMFNASHSSETSVSSSTTIASQSPGNTVTLYVPESGRTSPTSDPWDIESSTRDLALIDTVTGDARILLHNQKIASYRLSPDGSKVAVTIPTRFEAPGSQQIIFDLVEVTTDASVKRSLASGIRLDYGGENISWSPDSSHIAFIAFGDGEQTGDVFVTESNQLSPRNLTSFSETQYRVHGKAQTPLWDDDSKEIFFIRDGSVWRGSLTGQRASRIVDIPGRKITRLIGKSNDAIWRPGRSGTTIAITHDDIGKRDGFYEVDLSNGKSEIRMEGNQCYECSLPWEFVVLPGVGKFVYPSEDGQHSKDLWVSDPSFNAPRRLTHLNPQFEKSRMGSSRLVSWLSGDGSPLQGALLLPPNYKEGERLALIVLVYGGAYLSEGVNRFGTAFGPPFNMQFFATRGYAAFLPDAPVGEGTATLDLTKDVLPGINKLVEMGFVDTDRVGIMGHSNGGFSVLALITQTKRFKAAIEIAGTADEISCYGEMDSNGAAFCLSTLEAKGDHTLGGTPWEVRDRYIENSPIFHFDRITTPLLIIHGDQDTTVAPFLGDQVFVSLRRLNKVVEYAKYRGEGHAPLVWSFANQVDFCDRLIGWFNKYLSSNAPQLGQAIEPVSSSMTQ